jgi:hypothetical protein
MEMILIYPVFVLMSLAAAQLARQKGYSARWWFLITLVLPVLGMFILFGLKRKPRTRISVEPDWAKQQIPHDTVLFRKEDSAKMNEA